MTHLQISLIQMDVYLGQPQENFERAAAFVGEAVHLGSDLALLPELWTSGYALEHAAELASPLGEGTFQRMASLAREYAIALGGSSLELDSRKVYNTFVLYDSNGSLLATYRKVHLFRLMDEHLWLSPGGTLVNASLPWGRTGLAICYDLRFPEMFRRYAAEGALLVLMPAEWPASRLEAWRTLLRARAIENQLFMAGVNRVGESRGEIFGGASAVIDPQGRAITEGGDQEALFTAELDLEEVERTRKRIPILQDRRLDLYG